MKKNYIVTFSKLRELIKYLIKGEVKVIKKINSTKKINKPKFNSVCNKLKIIFKRCKLFSFHHRFFFVFFPLIITY